MTEWRLKAYRHWLTMREPHWAKLRVNPIDYQSISYFSAPKRDPNAPKSLDEVDPKLLATYEKLGVPLHERARLAGVAVDAVFDSVSVATTFKERLAEAGVIFCSFSDAVQNHPALIEQYLGTVVPHTRQLLRGAQLRGVLRRLVRLRAAGRALPDGAVDLLPHQRQEHRPVRAHADHRRAGLARELPRRLHRAHARREPAARGGGGAHRRGRRARSSTPRCRTGTRAMRTASAASTTSSPSAANAAAAIPRSPGRRSKPARRSPGNIRPACCSGENSVGEFYSVAVANNYQQADTGTKMIHIGANTKSTIVSKGISAGHGQNSYRGLVKILPCAHGARNFTQCDSLLMGGNCGAHTFPYIETRNPSATVEHEASTSKISEDQLVLLPAAWHRRRGRGRT